MARAQTIDFDATARRIVELTDLGLMREQLELSWNDRGAADVAKNELELSAQMGTTKAGPYVKNLDRVLRTLIGDRRSHDQIRRR